MNLGHYPRKQLFVIAALLLLAAGFRIFVAHHWPNDAPDDGRVYAQMARNVLEQHVFSHDTQAPFQPSLIRLPGYPLFLASIYSVFGHTNNGAVRIIQALIDTATCALVALLAFYWQPDEKRKRATAIAALALAAVCPFTTIYSATILTEVLTNFLIMALFVAVTLAFRNLTIEDTEKDKRRNFRQAIVWWCVAGLIGGLAVLMRPDSGLFLAAVGLTLVVTAFRVPTLVGLLIRKKSPTEVGTLTTSNHRRFALSGNFKQSLVRGLVSGALFCFTFVLVLTPWTIRNWRVFHLFQPLAPAHGEMPGEFVPRGYELWLRTWLDDESYVAPFLWSLDTDPIDVDDVPPAAFDSAAEKQRVATLLEAYNGESDSGADANADSQTDNNAKADENEDNGENNQTDEPESDQKPSVEMTPEIDAGFAQLARERIARHRFKFYVWLPLKRARTMWFDTHSQYWPFEGTLLPFEDLDYEHHQQIWLPMFAGLTAVYTLLGLAGGWLLWSSQRFDARRVLLMTLLAIVMRLILFSSIENPEPRYLVEFFPFLSVLGGIAIAQVAARTSLSATRAQHAQ